MAHAIDELLSSSALSEEVRSSISEAWNSKQTELREEIASELREEFAERYENDKAQIVEAMNSMIENVIADELKEFKQDRDQVVQDRVAYRKHMKEHAKVLDAFVTESLRKEVGELREDRKAQGKNMTQLESFVVEQLTKELNEFHEDKRELVEAKVKMIREGKSVIERTKRKFVENASKKINVVLENAIRNELTTLREDIQVAKENSFGRKIFETFAAEFMTSYLNEGTEVSKLHNQLNNLSRRLDEAEQSNVHKDVQLAEASRKTRMAEDNAERKLVMNEMMAPLSKNQRDIMGALLESTRTADLRTAYNKYLPSVLSESNEKRETSKKKVLSESTKDVTGNKSTALNETVESNIVNLRKLAGIS